MGLIFAAISIVLTHIYIAVIRRRNDKLLDLFEKEISIIKEQRSVDHLSNVSNFNRIMSLNCKVERIESKFDAYCQKHEEESSSKNS